MAKTQTIHLPANKNLTITVGVNPSVTYREIGNTIFTITEDTTISSELRPRNISIDSAYGVQYSIDVPADSSDEVSLSLSGLYDDTGIRTKTYVESGDADMEYNIHFISKATPYMTLTFPDPSTVTQGKKHLIVNGATNTSVFNEIRIAGGGQFYFGHSTATHDAIEFEDGTHGANVIIVAIDNKWVSLGGLNNTPYSD